MNFKTLFSTLFRKYALFRVLTWSFIALIIVGSSVLIGFKIRKAPLISSINPPVGSPGDIMVITGNNFGTTRNSSYVEVGDSRLTASGYLSWNNTEIKVVLPSNVQDGLVIVGTSSGRSKPAFFANEAAIPVAIPPDIRTALPVITSLSANTGSYGALLVITGTNFGTVRNKSLVFFSANHDDTGSSSYSNGQQLNTTGNANPNFISSDENNFDYEYWSDTELHVRIPDGAASGPLYVKTDKGSSNTQHIEISSSIGTRQYTDKRTYLLQDTTDILNSGSKNNATLTIRVPRPAISSQQPFAEMTDSTPAPVISNYQHAVVYQTDLGHIGSKKIHFNQDFVVTDYALKTNIDQNEVKPFSEKSRLLYTLYTASDTIIRSDLPAIVNLADQIIGKEKNPYIQAKLIYNYLLDNYQLLQKNRKGSDSPEDILETKSGDAYDFSIVFAELLRAIDIPAIPVSGVLVDSELKTKSHWWNEFYVEDFGWIPVDPSLAAGLEYKPFQSIDNPREFYFGNIDSQHIVFSRGWNQVRSSTSNSKIVYLPRTYALQSIWEESSGGNVNYSSLWNAPVVIGVY